MGLVLASLILLINPSLKVDAAINNTINFQSKIVNKTTGLNITEGNPACVKSGADTCDFQVRVWNSSSGVNTSSGTGNLMFTQTFLDVEIGATNGIFNLIINSCGSSTSGNSQWGTSIGSCTVIDDSDSDSDPGVNFDRNDLWIEVSFANADTSGTLGSFTETFSRTMLRSVPSAFVAQTLAGIGASGFVQIAPSATQVSTSTNSLVNLETTANTSNALFRLNENGAGSPSLMDLRVGGTSRLILTNLGQLQLPNTSVAAGISIGGDTQISRSSANVLATGGDDSFSVGVNLGVGGSPFSSAKISVQDSNTTDTGSRYGLHINQLNTVVTSSPMYGAYIRSAANPGTGNNFGTVYGVYSFARLDDNAGIGTATNLYGGYFFTDISAGDVTNSYALYARATPFLSGTVDNTYGLYVLNDQDSAITGTYGIYVASNGTTPALGYYNIFSEGAYNRFTGRTSFGDTDIVSGATVAISDTGSVMDAFGLYVDPSFSGSGFKRGLTVNSSYSPTSSTLGLYAIDSTAQAYPGTGNTLTSAYGLSSSVSLGSAGTVTSMYAGRFGLSSSIGTATNGFGLFVSSSTAGSGGSITNNYGLYIDNQTAGTTDYGIYVVGADTYAIWSDNGVNRFDGNTVIGGATPGGRLDVIGGFLALDNGDFAATRGLRFRNTIDTTTPTGGGLYQANNNNLYIQAGSANFVRIGNAAGSDVFIVDTANNRGSIGTFTSTAFFNIAPSTSAQASLRLESSVGVNPSAPNSGDLWWNGTSLFFRTGSSTLDLLSPSGGGVTFAPGSEQSTATSNSLINIANSGTSVSNPLLRVNFTGTGTPNLLSLLNGGVNRLQVASTGQLILTPETNTNNVINITANYNTTGGASSGMSFTVNQLAATLGSIDSFLLTPTASIAGGGNVAGMNGILVRPSTFTSGTTVSTARGFSSWPNISTGTTITNYFGVSILNPSGGGTITNNFGIRVDNQTFGTNDYGLYVEGADTYAIWSDSGLNRFDGNVQLGGVLTGIPGTNNTRIQASGSTIGNGNSASIYFLDSSGTNRGRIDTAKTVQGDLDGDGSDGAITISSTININTTPIASGRVTYADGIAYRVNPPGIGDRSVTRFRSADLLDLGLTAGDEVLLINLQGNTVVAGSNPSIDTASVGNYEILTIASTTASAITFTTPIQGRYVGLNAANQRVVIQRIPNYTNVTIDSGGTLTASAYEGLATVPTGGAGYLTGIVAFKANGTVTVNTGGTISANALGYRGGAAGASGANGGFNGESYDIVGNNTAGRGGSGATGGETWGGGRASNGAIAATNNGTVRGGGGGGGSNGSASTGDDGSGAGGGGGYGGGGGGGGGGSNGTALNGGAGGSGGGSEVSAGGGGGAQNTVAAGVAGGSGGLAGSSATGAGGAAGSGQISGAGGAGAALTTSGGGGGGGGGLYGDPLLRNLFFGSGGGGGAGGISVNTAGQPGGNGGGIILIMADSISLPGTGTITSNGAAATNGTAPASGGGGGAGGSIKLQANTLSLGSGLVTANGGGAGTLGVRRGAAGAGGVGRIYYEYSVSDSGTTSPLATIALVTNNYGTLYIGNVNTQEADLAEYYVTGDRSIEAGDVVSISPFKLMNDNNQEIASQGVLRKSEEAYDSKLLGVISTAPGITLGSKDAATGQEDNRALALKGRVPVKIDSDSEPISIGDFLTSSSKPGYAKKATQPGYVIGKSLEYWNNSMTEKTKIMTFVDLGYYNGGNSTSEEALRLAANVGVSITGYNLPSRIVNIISRATDATYSSQVLGTAISNSESSSTQQDTLESNTVTNLENSLKLSLGRTELSDYYGGENNLELGDVVKLNSNNNIIKAGGIDLRGDAGVLGVISSVPSTLISGLVENANNKSVSMGGRVILKVTDINGPIKKGDYLAASDIPGYAMKADNSNGTVLGRALEDFPLSLSADSAMVQREISKTKMEIENLLEGLNIDQDQKQKLNENISTLLTNYQESASSENNTGRIMAFVNVGFITEGVMMPKTSNLDSSFLPDSDNEILGDLNNVINKLKDMKLTLNNILTVKNVIEAQTYQNITGLDLAFKITSANNSFRIINVSEESLFQVDQNGKISIRSGSNSSIGKAVILPGSIEVFVENSSITENSQIYLTPDQFVFSRVKTKNPGSGFWIELQNGFAETTVNVDYLIIN